MRKLLLFILFFVSVLSLNAQSSQLYRWDPQREEWVYSGGSRVAADRGFMQQGYSIVQAFDNRGYNLRPPTLVLPKHELGFHIASPEMGGSLIDGFEDKINMWNFPVDSPSVSPWDEVNNDRIYKENEITGYMFSLSYLYSPKNWVQVGLIGTMRYHEYNFNYVLTRTPYDTLSDYMYAITPTIRLNYVATKYIRMYVGLGVSFQWAKYENSFSSSRTMFNQDWDVTAFGFSVGNKLFASFEAGYLSSGYVKFIVGCRF